MNQTAHRSLSVASALASTMGGHRRQFIKTDKPIWSRGRRRQQEEGQEEEELEDVAADISTTTTTTGSSAEIHVLTKLHRATLNPHYLPVLAKGPHTTDEKYSSAFTSRSAQKAEAEAEAEAGAETQLKLCGDHGE